MKFSIALWYQKNSLPYLIINLIDYLSCLPLNNNRRDKPKRWVH